MGDWLGRLRTWRRGFTDSEAMLMEAKLASPEGKRLDGIMEVTQGEMIYLHKVRSGLIDPEPYRSMMNPYSDGPQPAHKRGPSS